MLKLFSRYVPIRSLFLWGGETCLIVSVVAAFGWGSVMQDGQVIAGVESPLVTVIMVALLCQVSLYYHDLYVGPRSNPTWRSFMKILQSFAVALLIVVGLILIFPDWGVGRGMIVALCVLPFALILWRVAYARLVSNQIFTRNILLVGTGRLAEDVVAALNTDSASTYAIRWRLPELPRADAPPTGFGALMEPSLLGVLRQSQVDHVVIALGDRRGKFPIDDLLRCKFSRIAIEDGPSFYERVTGKVHLDALRPSCLIFSDGFEPRPVTEWIKRGFDVAVSLVGLALLVPLGLVVALLIVVDSGWPVLYRQERVGQGGRVFRLIKFRSMRRDAEDATGPVWAKDQDDRVTRLGKWLRTFRLDELPQLVNVLRGEMSIVGPRPERPCFVEHLTTVIPYYGFRHAVKPGITGWAQVRYRYGSSIEDTVEKLQYDLCYIKNMSLVWDATILLDTVKIICLGQGAR